VTADEKQWAHAAARLSGTYSVSASGHATIRMDVDPTEISIETLGPAERGLGFGNQGRSTRLGALLTSLGEVELHVERRTLFGALLSRVPAGEVRTGDIAFDRAYRVTGAPRLLVLEVLDHELRKAIVERGQLRDSEVEAQVRRQRLVIEQDGHLQRSEDVVALALYGETWARRWNAVASAPAATARRLDLSPIQEPVDLSEGTMLVARGLRRGHEVTLSVWRTEDRLATVIGLARDFGTAFTLSRLEDEISSEGTAPDELRALFEGAPATVLALRSRGASELEVVLEGIAPDVKVTSDFVDALLEGAGSAGTYR
jgi:hypothetical protein